MSVHPNCSDDPLSSVLSLVGLECAPVVRVEAGGSWAIRFASHLPITFGVVVEGGAWLATETGEEPIWLAPGDCFLVMGTRPHQICSDRTAEAKDAAEGDATSDEPTGEGDIVPDTDSGEGGPGAG